MMALRTASATAQWQRLLRAAALIAAFEGAWFACVVGAAQGWPWAGTAVAAAVIVAIVVLGGRPGVDAALVAVALAIGLAWDSGLALLGWLASRSWFYTALGVSPNLAAPNDALALLLFALALPVFGFFVSPLAALLSRRHEFEADAYACAQANGADLASALIKLHQDNASTLTPDPVYVRFYYSHPPAGERLAALSPSPA